MKRLTTKSLAVLLALALASTMFVSAFAQTESSEEILMFNMDIDYKTNTVFTIYFGVMGYSIFNAEDFAFSIYDSQENVVFNETMCDVEAMTPEYLDSAKSAAVKKALADDPVEEPMVFMLVWLTVIDEFVVNPDETYTIVIAAGSFSNEAQELSPELTYEFLPSDYIYIPTIWDKILFVLNSNPVLQVLFARVIMIIEFFYYSPWFPMPLFG